MARHPQTGPPGLSQRPAPGLRKDRRLQRERSVLSPYQRDGLVGRITAGDERVSGRQESPIVDGMADDDEFQRQAPVRCIAGAVQDDLETLVDADRADDADAAWADGRVRC